MKSQDELRKDGQEADEVKEMLKGLRDLVIVGQQEHMEEQKLTKSKKEIEEKLQVE